MSAHLPLLEAALGLAGWTAVRATLLLAGAALLAFVLRRSSVAARHALWTVTLGGLLALPVLSVVLPPVPVEVPGWEIVTRILGGGGPAREQGRRAATDGLSVGPHLEVEMLGGGPGSAASPSTAAASPSFSAAPPSSSAAPPARGGDGALPPSGAVPTGPFLLLLLWMGGVFALSVPLALGMARARRMCLRALPLGDAGWPVGPWMAALERAAAQVGLRRRVNLRVSPRARTALAGGVRRPVVLLPDDAVQWSDERRDLVLSHELVHLRRFDPVRQLCGRLVLALYWFHPLAWWAVRAAAIAREEACDEAVLRLGHRPSTYARHLVELAGVRHRPLPALSAMDSPRLEKRIMMILHAPHRTDGPRRRRWAIAGSTACAAAWALAATLVMPVDRAVAAAPDGAAVEEVGQASDRAPRAPSPDAPPPDVPDASSPRVPDPLPPVVHAEPRPPDQGLRHPTDTLPRVRILTRPDRAGETLSVRRGVFSDELLDSILVREGIVVRPGEGGVYIRADSLSAFITRYLDRDPPGVYTALRPHGPGSVTGAIVLPTSPRAPRPPPDAPDADPRCAPLRVGPAREVAAERRAEAEPMLSTVLERPDGSWLCIQRRGAAQFGADGRLLSSLPDGDWLVVAGTDGDGQRRVEMEGRAGAADTYWLVNGEEHPYGDEAQAWLVGALQQLDRHRTILPVRSLREFRPLPDTIHNLEQLREELQTRREEAGVGSPMVVIDGVVVDRDPASMIDPERIETIQVIPGEEGAERYGPRARYGIVVITTNPR